MIKSNLNEYLEPLQFVPSPPVLTQSVLSYIPHVVNISPNSTWLVTSRLDTTRSTCRAHTNPICSRQMK